MSRSFFLAVLVLSALGEFATGAFMPLLPRVGDEFGLTAALVQSTVSAYIYAYALGQIVCGPLSDAIGRRPVTLAGLVLLVIGSGLAAFAGSITALVVARIVQGLGVSACYVVSRAIIRDVSDPADVARRMSLLMLAFACLVLVSPLLGGVLGDTAGWRALFGLTAVVAAAMLAYVLLRLRETNAHRSSGHAALRALPATYRRLLAHSGYMKYVVSHALGYAGLYAFLAVFPLLAADVYALGSTGIGSLVALVMSGFVIGLLVVGRVSARYSPDACIVIGLAIMLLAVAALAALMLGDRLGLAALLGLQMLYMFGGSFVAPNTTAAVMLMFPRAAGLASAGLGALSMAGAASAVAVAGVLYRGRLDEVVVLQCSLAVASAVIFAVVRARPGDGEVAVQST